MNIWDWVIRLEDELESAGQEQLSRLIEQVPQAVLNLNIEHADKLVAEGINLNQSLNNPWLDIFFKHWGMRNRIGNKAEGATVLSDINALFKFTQHDEVMTCPQTICIARDLVACYANMDGKGYLAERKQLCDSAFTRIDASWASFQCLSCEYASVLVDENKLEEALVFLRQQKERVIASGSRLDDAFSLFEASLLLKLNQPSDALAIIESSADEEGYLINEQNKQIIKAHALAMLNQVDEAWVLLPSWNDLAPRFYLPWIGAVSELIVKEPEKNIWSLGSAIKATLDYLVSVGSYQYSIEVAQIYIELALARGAISSARKVLAIANTVLPKLKEPKETSLLLTALVTEIERQDTPIRLPVEPSQLLAWLDTQKEGIGSNPELAFPLLLLAYEVLPDDRILVEAVSSALHACHFIAEAQTILWQYIENNHQEDTTLPYYLLSFLVKNNQFDEISRLAGYYQTTQPPIALWCLIQQAYCRDEFDQAKSLCLELLALIPTHQDGLRVLVAIAARQQDFITAEQYQQQLVSTLSNEDAQEALWNLLTYSTLNLNWVLARQIAVQLKLPIQSTEGIIEENWGWVRIEIEEAGEILSYLAQCTGPVTAVIKEPAKPNKTQRIDDWVVYDFAQLAPMPQTDEERKYFIPVYRAIKTLRQGHFGKTWLVDGVHPGNGAFKAFEQLVDKQGWRLWVNSTANYQLTDQFDLDEDRLAGVFFSIAAPDHVSPKEIHQLLSRVVEEWEYPVHWLSLAQEVGADLTPHYEVKQRYNL